MAKGKSRPDIEINASSMADIAFLLLVFFLMVTKMDLDKGISIRLPEWSELPPEDIELQDRNAFIVLINSRDQLLVENELMEIDELRAAAKKFIDNGNQPNPDPTMSDSPGAAVISFKADVGTSYDMYLNVFNELKAAYNELRSDFSKKKFNAPYTVLDSVSQAVVRDAYPMRISKAEPTKFGKQE